MIYLDNAATSYPKPFPVINAVNRGIYISANPGRSGHFMSMRASAQVYEVRKKLADFFNCPSPENVVFTQNCTQSLNTALNGLLHQGDHVVTSCLEHNSVLRVLEHLRQEGIITYSVAKVDPFDDDETVQNFKKAINGRTKFFVFTHASNVFGYALPVKELGKLALKRNIKIILDGAQTAGVLPIDMINMNIYALCIPCHKGLYASMGTGALLLREDCFIKPFMFGGTGSESMNKNQPEFLPDRLESGTLNLPGIMSIGAGIDFITGLGIQKIHEYEMNLCDDLYNYLYNCEGITIHSVNNSDFAPIFSFNVKGLHSEEVAEHLDRDGIFVRAGYHCASVAHESMGTEQTGAVRVSPGIFNRKSDIKKLINSLIKIEKS